MHKALFFGSFNPIHIGHLRIAEFVIEHGLADEVVFMVSPMSPFKKDQPLLDDDIRFELVKLAIEGIEGFSASNMEFSLPKPSFTAKTLEVIRNVDPQHKYSVLLGSDQVEHFHQWQRYEEILKHHKVLLYPRPGVENPDLSKYPAMELLVAPVYDIAATEIRHRIENRDMIDDLLPEKVAQRIFQCKYYRK